MNPTRHWIHVYLDYAKVHQPIIFLQRSLQEEGRSDHFGEDWFWDSVGIIVKILMSEVADDDKLIFIGIVMTIKYLRPAGIRVPGAFTELSMQLPLRERNRCSARCETQG